MSHPSKKHLRSARPEGALRAERQRTVQRMTRTPATSRSRQLRKDDEGAGGTATTVSSYQNTSR